MQVFLDETIMTINLNIKVLYNKSVENNTENPQAMHAIK